MGQPVIKAGQEVRFVRLPDGMYAYECAGKRYSMSLDELMTRFTVEKSAQAWEVVHEGLQRRYPDHAAQLRKRLIALGIDKWLDWQFQQEDLVELLMKPNGAVARGSRGAASRDSPRR